MVNTYHAELEFDWWERGQDFIQDMWGGRMSLRKIWTIIHQLPPDSALHRKVNPQQWAAEHYLLADVIDVLQAANWQRGGSASVPRPRPYPRPADESGPVGSGLLDDDSDEREDPEQEPS